LIKRCNIVAIIFTYQYCFGAGDILRDELGHFTKAKKQCGNMHGILEAKNAEAWGLLQAIQWIAYNSKLY